MQHGIVEVFYRGGLGAVGGSDVLLDDVNQLVIHLFLGDPKTVGLNVVLVLFLQLFAFVGDPLVVDVVVVVIFRGHLGRRKRRFEQLDQRPFHICIFFFGGGFKRFFKPFFKTG